MEKPATVCCRDKLIEHKMYIAQYGEDMPEISGWTWGRKEVRARESSTEGDNIESPAA